MCLSAHIHLIAVCYLMLCYPGTASAFDIHHCEEKRFNQSIRKSDHNPNRVGLCRSESADFKRLGEFYWIDGGKAYFHTTEKTYERPCSGGGPGSLGNFFNPMCYLPRWLQRHHFYEIRNFWLASEDGANFKQAPTRYTGSMSPLQASSMARYAVDRKRVYLNGEVIEDVDPVSFEMLFPFGADERWERFNFSRDRDHLLVDHWTLSWIELPQVQWIGVPCASDLLSLERCQGHPVGETPRLGRFGNKLLFLQVGYRPGVLEGIDFTDLRCENRLGGLLLCRGQTKIYEINIYREKLPSMILLDAIAAKKWQR